MGGIPETPEDRLSCGVGRLFLLINPLSGFRSPFSAGSSTSGQGKKPGNGVNGLAFGLHVPEKAPIKLLMLRREEITCGGRDGSVRRSVSMLRASFSTERSTPVPLPAFW